MSGIITQIGSNLASAGSSLLGDAAQAASNALGPAAAALLANTGPFRTQPATTPTALFSLAIRQATMPYLPLFIYTFPLTPSALRKDTVGMANYYDVAGTAANFGVQRIVDIYGQTLPVFSISGTTGVKYHSTDNFLTTGLESINILQGAISQYFAMVAAAGAVTNTATKLPRLEFYNYYSGEFYQVVPIGPQGISQDANRPQLLNYQFKWVAVYNLAAPIAAAIDSIVGAISGPISAGISSLGTSIGNTVSSYGSSAVSSVENFV